MVRADQILVARGLFDSRAKAQEAIAAGLVSANGKPVKKPSESLPDNAEITARAAYPWVSRGGVKLAHALATFDLGVNDRLCLDVGSSTGGFTHVMLEGGARHVYAVDSGRGQLHPSLQGHARLSLFEETDIRSFALPQPCTFAAIDVSFISLRLVLPAVIALLAPSASVVALVKPQFEAGRQDIGKGGLVKDSQVHERTCEAVRMLMQELGATIVGLEPSPITGGDGNREFLMAARVGP